MLLLPGCKKDEVNKIPEITLLSIGPTNVEEFVDEVTLRFSYNDGDGDIGSFDPDERTLRVKDSRLENPDWYHIPPMAPEGSSPQIQGELEITLNPLFLLGNGSQESVTFSITLFDRAGNLSNELVSPVILVHDSL